MEQKYGETNWGDTKTGGGNDFINIVQGSNKFRIVTKPYQFVVHWIKDPSGANRKLRCATKNCPICQHLDSKAQYRWYVGVISRTEQKCGILEISSQIMAGVKGLVADSDWGDPINYDVDIARGPKGAQPLYNVNPKPHKKLTKEESAMVDTFLEGLDLNKLVVPPTPEALAEKLEELGFSGTSPVSKSNDEKDDEKEEPFNFEKE